MLEKASKINERVGWILRNRPVIAVSDTTLQVAAMGTGLKTKAPRYPVLAEWVRDGRHFKLPAFAVTGSKPRFTLTADDAPEDESVEVDP